MSPKEQAQAGNALVGWFNSQEIGPSDAQAIMSKVLALRLTLGVKTRDEANRALDTFMLQLVHDMNNRLYSRKHGGEG